MKEITARQEMVLDFIVKSIRNRMYPPTLREIAKYMGIKSTNGVNDYLLALQRKGYIVSEELISRGIRLTDKTKEKYKFGMKDFAVDMSRGELEEMVEHLIETAFLRWEEYESDIPAWEWIGIDRNYYKEFFSEEE